MKTLSLWILKKGTFQLLLLLQSVVVALVLWYSGHLVLADFSQSGDAPSYLLFPFSSFSEALSSHRTFGLPLFLKVYELLFDDERFWPAFQFFFYVSSIFFLYGTLIRAEFSRPTAFMMATGLLWNPTVIPALKHIESETLTATFLILILSFLLRTVCSRSKKGIAFLGIAVFYLYQIRPNMAFIIFLVPIWAYAFEKLLLRKERREALEMSVKVFSVGFVPLLAFCLLRLAVVGDFGLASFSGTALSGQATSYLNDRNVSAFTGETRKLAEEILWRKNRLSPPCNQLEGLSFQERSNCGNIYIMISWLSAIRQTLGTEPFKDPEKNREPWKYANLSPFFSINNVEIESLLKQYSLAMLWQERRNFLPRLFYVYSRALRFYAGLVLEHFAYVVAILLAIATFGITKISLALKKPRPPEKNLEARGRDPILFLAFMAVTLMIFGVASTGMMIHFDTRYLLLFGSFLLSAIFVCAVPPSLQTSDRQDD